MILLIGNNRDDLLYFETIMNNKKHETVLERYTVTVGTIFNQAVVLVNDIYTNVLSSLVTSYLIEKYYIMFVIKIGKVGTISKELKNGEIVISRKIKAIDVDVTDLQGTKLGQIPGFKDSYDTLNEIYTMISNSFLKRANIIIKDATFLSSNVHYTNKTQIDYLLFDNKIFAEDVNRVVFDSEAFGIATSCAIYDIPFLSIGVIFNKIGDEFKTSDYVKVLAQYTNIGKAISNTIGEIGSNEVLRG